MQGFAAGIMIAASFWSLLQPAINYGAGSAFAWAPAAIGVVLGGVFLRALHLVIPHLHPNTQDTNQYQAGVGTKQRNKNTMLVLRITSHNIPAGPARGAAYE